MLGENKNGVDGVNKVDKVSKSPFKFSSKSKKLIMTIAFWWKFKRTFRNFIYFIYSIYSIFIFS